MSFSNYNRTSFRFIPCPSCAPNSPQPHCNGCDRSQVLALLFLNPSISQAMDFVPSLTLDRAHWHRSCWFSRNGSCEAARLLAQAVLGKKCRCEAVPVSSSSFSFQFSADEHYAEHKRKVVIQIVGPGICSRIAQPVASRHLAKRVSKRGCGAVTPFAQAPASMQKVRGCVSRAQPPLWLNVLARESCRPSSSWLITLVAEAQQ